MSDIRMHICLTVYGYHIWCKRLHVCNGISHGVHTVNLEYNFIFFLSITLRHVKCHILYENAIFQICTANNSYRCWNIGAKNNYQQLLMMLIKLIYCRPYLVYGILWPHDFLEKCDERNKLYLFTNNEIRKV